MELIEQYKTNREKAIFLGLLVLIVSTLGFDLVSSLYVGESITITNDLGKENLIYTIIENTSELSVLPIVTINLTNITIELPDDMPPNEFKIVFLEEQTKVITQTVVVSTGNGGGGHSSKTKIINRTITKEIPNYITEENKTIEIVNNTITKTEYVKDKFPLGMFLLGLLAVVIILGLLWFYMNRLNKKYSLENKNIELEGGQENGN